MTVRSVSLEEFRSEIEAQCMPPGRRAFVCPMCKTVQSMRSFQLADPKLNDEEISALVGFSCVGRVLGAGAPRRDPDGQACNWTLGGLLRLHSLVVIAEDKVEHPHFEPATIKQAEALFEEQGL